MPRTLNKRVSNKLKNRMVAPGETSFIKVHLYPATACNSDSGSEQKEQSVVEDMPHFKSSCELEGYY